MPRSPSFALAALVLASCHSAEPPESGGAGPAPSDTGSAAEPAVAAPAALPSGSAAASREAEPPARWLKGQTHVHSSGSYDAKTEPERVLGFYAERGYDFVAITDHNHITVPPPRSDLLVIHGVELTQNSAQCQPPPTRGYRCLFHTTVLFVDPALDPHEGAVFRPPYRGGRYAAYSSHRSFAQRVSGVAAVAHPLFHFAADARLLGRLARDGARLVEFFNAALDAQHPRGIEAARVRAEALWDDVLSNGERVYALAVDDAHHFYEHAEERRRQHRSAYVGDRAWIRVRAARQPAAIRAALERGDFYASTGVELSAVERTRERVSLTVADARDPVRIRFVGRDGKVLAEHSGRRASYEPTGDEGYVRAVVSDARGAAAWTQPILLEAGP